MTDALEKTGPEAEDQSTNMPLPSISGTPAQQLSAAATQLTTAWKALGLEYQWLDGVISEARDELDADILSGWADPEDVRVYDLSLDADHAERHLSNICSCAAIARDAAKTIRAALPGLTANRAEGGDDDE